MELNYVDIVCIPIRMCKFMCRASLTCLDSLNDRHTCIHVLVYLCCHVDTFLKNDAWHFESEKSHIELSEVEVSV